MCHNFSIFCLPTAAYFRYVNTPNGEVVYGQNAVSVHIQGLRIFRFVDACELFAYQT